MRRLAFLIASVLVSLLFLWLALRNVPFARVLEDIQQADPAWIAVTVGVTIIGLWTRAIRWRGLLGFRIPLRDAFQIINITFMLNQLPLRAGEVARSLLATRSGVPVMTAATSIIVERLTDLLLVVVLLSAALANLPDAPTEVTQSAALFGVASVVGFVVMIYFARYPAVAHRILDFILNLLPILKRLPLKSLLDHILDGLKPLTHWRNFVHTIVWSLISWFFSLLTFYALHLAFGIEGVNLWLSCALGVTLASFSIALPVSVAGIGPFQAAILLAGELAGIQDNGLLLALGFVTHAVAILTYAALGTVGLVTMGVSLQDVFKAAEEKPKNVLEDAEPEPDRVHP